MFPTLLSRIGPIESSCLAKTSVFFIFVNVKSKYCEIKQETRVIKLYNSIAYKFKKNMLILEENNRGEGI